MKNRVFDFVEKHHMLKPTDHLLVGVSGGADSVCLLLLLRELQSRIAFEMTAVHVEHGIRGEESLADQHFVEELCERLAIPLLVYPVDVPRQAREKGQSLEEAARELRYGCFARACEQTGSHVIALAHHGDDCGETMLFHLARGTGVRGLCGILPKREMFFRDEKISIIRPLLCVGRDEIEEYLSNIGQDFRTDSTNGDLDYSRNRIRHQVLPELKQVNRQAARHMVQTSEYMAEISDFLDLETEQAMQRCVTRRVDDRGNLIALDVESEAFASLHPVIRKNLLLRGMEQLAGSRRDLGAEHIGEVMELFDMQVGKRLSLPYGMAARRTYRSVIFERADGSEKPDFGAAFAAIAPGMDYPMADGRILRVSLEKNSGDAAQISEKTYTKCFDYDKIQDTVQLRTRLAGDFLQVCPEGGSKKIKDYMINEKIPRDERDRIPLLAEGSHVLWVIGYRISEAYKVTGDTKNILRVSVLLTT